MLFLGRTFTHSNEAVSSSRRVWGSEVMSPTLVKQQATSFSTRSCLDGRSTPAESGHLLTKWVWFASTGCVNSYYMYVYVSPSGGRAVRHSGPVSIYQILLKCPPASLQRAELC